MTDAYIKDITNVHWEKYLASLTNEDDADRLDDMELFMKTILNNKSSEEFIDLLTSIDKVNLLQQRKTKTLFFFYIFRVMET